MVSKTIKNKTKEQKGRLLSVLLGTWSASLLGNPLTGKGVTRSGERRIRVGESFYCRFIL